MGASRSTRDPSVRSTTASDALPIEGGPAPADTADLDAAAIRAISGDADALNRVWEHNRRWVAAILLAHKPRWADVDDLLQEVALSLVKKVHEVRDPALIRPWLRTVALNVAHATARSGKVRSWVTGAQAGEPDHQPHTAPARGGIEAIEAKERSTSILDLAAQLPDGYREPLILKAVDNLSYREIGRMMGLPETTVETRIARARKQLRELAHAAELHE